MRRDRRRGLWNGVVRTQDRVEGIAASGEFGLCIIDEGRRLDCFGFRTNDRPEPISSLSVLNVTGLSNWNLTFCGLEADGTVNCFNADGSRIGDAQRFTAPDGLKLRMLRLGQESACGIDLAGEVRCWARAGSLAETPRGPFVDLAVSYESACGLRPDGTVACWGTMSTPPPRRMRFTTVAMSAWSPELACGVTTNSQAVCWGSGAGAELRRSLAAW
jgi:hypothetical protein